MDVSFSLAKAFIFKTQEVALEYLCAELYDFSWRFLYIRFWISVGLIVALLFWEKYVPLVNVDYYGECTTKRSDCVVV